MQICRGICVKKSLFDATHKVFDAESDDFSALMYSPNRKRIENIWFK